MTSLPWSQASPSPGLEITYQEMVWLFVTLTPPVSRKKQITWGTGVMEDLLRLQLATSWAVCLGSCCAHAYKVSA